jgi:hypothetical protein
MATAFSAEQIAALSAPLDRAKVRQREQGRTTVSYIKGWQAIAEANRIFGFDGWQRQTLQLRCIHQGERTIGRDHRPRLGRHLHRPRTYHHQRGLRCPADPGGLRCRPRH